MRNAAMGNVSLLMLLALYVFVSCKRANHGMTGTGPRYFCGMKSVRYVWYVVVQASTIVHMIVQWLVELIFVWKMMVYQ
jgi:hypothetical protein